MTPSGSSGASGLLVVANRKAGSGEQNAVGAAVEVLRTALPTEVRRTADRDELCDVLAEAEGRIVVVAGGDGSVHAAVSALRELGLLAATTLAIIPLGTGNDLARTFDLPLEPAPAAEAILRGRVRTIDLIAGDDGGIAVNAVHVGVGAEAALAAGRAKSAMGVVAYPLGALAAGLRAKGWEIEVTLDGALVDVGADRTLMVGIGNGATIGGGTALCPDADPADGVLDVLVAAAPGPVDRLRFGLALRKGRHLERDHVRRARGREVRIAGEPVRHNVDGEVSDPVADRTYRIEPGAWRLLAP